MERAGQTAWRGLVSGRGRAAQGGYSEEMGAARGVGRDGAKQLGQPSLFRELKTCRMLSYVHGSLQHLRKYLSTVKGLAG